MQVQIELPNNLLIDIQNIKNELVNLRKSFQPKEPTEFLTRQEVASLLKIDLSSVHNWTKKKILQSYQIGGRVYYKRSEVECSIIKLNK
jgi:excisionase family DNA binding protein